MCFWNSSRKYHYGFLNYSVITKYYCEPASIKLGYYSDFRIPKCQYVILGAKNVAIHMFLLGKFLDLRKYYCVKYLTNIIVWQLLILRLWHSLWCWHYLCCPRLAVYFEKSGKHDLLCIVWFLVPRQLGRVFRKRRFQMSNIPYVAAFWSIWISEFWC